MTATVSSNLSIAALMAFNSASLGPARHRQLPSLNSRVLLSDLPQTMRGQQGPLFGRFNQKTKSEGTNHRIVLTLPLNN